MCNVALCFPLKDDWYVHTTSYCFFALFERRAGLLLNGGAACVVRASGKEDKDPRVCGLYSNTFFFLSLIYPYSLVPWLTPHRLGAIAMDASDHGSQVQRKDVEGTGARGVGRREGRRKREK